MIIRSESVFGLRDEVEINRSYCLNKDSASMSGLIARKKPVLAFCSNCKIRKYTEAYKVRNLEGFAKPIFESKKKAIDCPRCGYALFYSRDYTKASYAWFWKDYKDKPGLAEVTNSHKMTEEEKTKFKKYSELKELSRNLFDECLLWGRRKEVFLYDNEYKKRLAEKIVDDCDVSNATLYASARIFLNKYQEHLDYINNNIVSSVNKYKKAKKEQGDYETKIL